MSRPADSAWRQYIQAGRRVASSSPPPFLLGPQGASIRAGRRYCQAAMRRMVPIALLAACLALAGCGGHATTLIKVKTESAAQSPVSASGGIGFPVLATKNTTRVSFADPAAVAAGVALAVFPS